MENFVQLYFAFIADLLEKVLQESEEAIREAAKAVADAIYIDKQVLVYGSGHSTLIAQDMAGRAGGLVPVLALQDAVTGDAERIEGIAKVIAGRYDLQAGSVMIVISNSGINPVPIEMAMLSKEAGQTVIAITSLSHSKVVDSRHSSGSKLYQIADIVINTCGVSGDAAINLPGGKFKSGATSTVSGAAILQAITVQAAALLVERGMDPPIFVSANLPEGDAHNREMITRYRAQLVRYQIPTMDRYPHTNDE